MAGSCYSAWFCCLGQWMRACQSYHDPSVPNHRLTTRRPSVGIIPPVTPGRPHAVPVRYGGTANTAHRRFLLCMEPSFITVLSDTQRSILF
jgi:hypothetical protein